MRARLLAATAVAALAAVSVPSYAAAPKSTALYFGNVGGSCSGRVFALTNTSNEGTECGVIKAGAAGNGALGTDGYTSNGKKAVGYKLDTKRKLTGTIHIVTLVGVTVSGTTPTVPTAVAADISVYINGVPLGTIKASGLTGTSSLAVPVSLTIPASLKNKAVKSVQVDVKWTQAFWATTLSYTGATQSKLSVPTL